VPAKPWERLFHHGNGPAVQDALLGLRNVLVVEVPYRRPDPVLPAPSIASQGATLAG
jgi:hypothetical protein